MTELEKELKSAGADVSAFDYVRRTREISRMTMSASATGGSSTPVPGGQGGELFKGFSALGNRVRAYMFLFDTLDLLMKVISVCTAYRSFERRWP
jgi:hypothetical protein